MAVGARYQASIDEVVSALRRQGPDGLTANQLAERLRRSRTGVMSVLRRNERTPANPDGLFVRIVDPAKSLANQRNIRWVLANEGA